MATCDKWIIVATAQFLRVFSYSGAPRHVVSLDGPVVTMAAHGKQLAIVTHSTVYPGACASSKQHAPPTARWTTTSVM